MATVPLITEEEAKGEVAEIYKDIKSHLGIDFVPNMFKAMASKPDYLEAMWSRTQAIMKPGKLGALTKEIIAVSVSAVIGCEY